MKEIYFSNETITSTSQEMLSAVFPDGQKRARSLHLDKSALLVLDMQEYFLRPESHAFVPSAPAIVPYLKQLIRSFRSYSLPVLFTQHINSHQDAGNMKRWWRDLITADHPLQGLISDLKVGDASLLRKSQYDAFYRTDLETRLISAGVEQVLIGGVMTHLCCESTARSAFVRGFDVFFLVDGTASYRRSYHLSTLRNLGHGVATLMTCDQVIRAFRIGA